MKLYIDEKTYSFHNKYDICDINGNVIYNVVNEFFLIRAKIHIYDIYGEKKFYVRKKFTFALGKYEVFDDQHRTCAMVSQEITFFDPKLKISSSYGDLEICGNFMNMNYIIYRNGVVFGSVQKVEMGQGDSIEITIPPTGDMGFVCALVLTIDNCLHYEQIS